MSAPCAANIRETKIAFGFVAQPDVQVKNTDAELWSLSKVNAALLVVDPQTEDNAADIGKGNEFPTEVYPTQINVAGPLEKYLSSQWAAWVFSFGLGKQTETVVGTGVQYACIPMEPETDCINLPAFTMVERIREEPESVVNRGMIGCVINDFTLNLESGPGRANARLAANIVGTGKVEQPSTSVIPALTPENALNAAGSKITIQGVDYVLNKGFISLQVQWNNNVRLDTGLYPGSGVDENGFAMRGRMEFGDRTCEVSFVARAMKGSVELYALMEQTEGPATIEVVGGLFDAINKHSIKLEFPRTRMSAVVVGEQNGIVTVNCNLRVLQSTVPATPYCTFTAVTTKPGIEVLNEGGTTTQRRLAA
jgi:hypothetical protein